MSDGSAEPERVISGTTDTGKPLCVLAVPHNGYMVPEILGTLAAASERFHVDVLQVGSSLLCHNFNKAWCDALNYLPKRPDYMAMCHSDISAPSYWIDVMLSELEEHNADFCSAVVPIKDNRGLTSTALMNTKNASLRRLTTHEVAAHHYEVAGARVEQAAPQPDGRLRYGDHGQEWAEAGTWERVRHIPETFTGDQLAKAFGAEGDPVALCVNSALWLCKFGPWAETIAFETGDRITREPDPTHARGERFVARCFSEDWFFSSQLVERGLKVIATSKIPVVHFGRVPFGTGGPNHKGWGMKQDEWIEL